MPGLIGAGPETAAVYRRSTFTMEKMNKGVKVARARHRAMAWTDLSPNLALRPACSKLRCDWMPLARRAANLRSARKQNPQLKTRSDAALSLSSVFFAPFCLQCSTSTCDSLQKTARFSLCPNSDANHCCRFLFFLPFVDAVDLLGRGGHLYLAKKLSL